MFDRFALVSILIGVVISASVGTPTDESREALQKLNDFIGDWKGVGGPDKAKLGPEDPTWKETISWAWRFKKDDRWLVLQIQGGTYLKGGELKYNTEKKLY